MNKLVKYGLIAGMVGAMLSGCASVPGSQQSDTPPRLKVDSNGNHIWDDPKLFGPVPENLQATGQSTCAKMDVKDIHFEATGYHSMAQDENGNTIKDGAFYCSRKKNM